MLVVSKVDVVSTVAVRLVFHPIHFQSNMSYLVQRVEPMKMTIWLWLAKDATTVSTPTLRHAIL